MDASLVEALVGLISYKDASTAAHTWRVVLYARAIADELAWDEPTKLRLARAAALHDIGKIDIPGDILRKPARLDDEEVAIIREHPALGYDRLRSLGETDQLVLDLVRHHHERWDGTGYPDGLAGEQIPEAARHFAVVDTFDALTSRRPYRAQVGPEAGERAVAIIREGRGTCYANESVDLFCTLYDAGKLAWIMDYYNDEADLAEAERVAEHAPFPLPGGPTAPPSP